MSRRGPDEGSIYQRESDGRWVGALHLGWDRTGRHRKYVYGKTRREVQLKLADLRRQHGLGVRVDLADQTVEQFITRWLAYKKNQVRPRTYDSYQMYLNRHVKPVIGHFRLQKLRAQDVQKMLDAEDMEPRSIKAVRDILRNALNDAVRWGECERNQAAHAQPPAQVRTQVAAMTPKEAVKLLKGCEGDRLEALYRVTLAVGLRRSEALGLKWEDVDLEKGSLQIRRGLHRAPGVGLVLEEPKSAQSRRDVALPGMAIKALKSHRKRQAAERLRAGKRWQNTGHVFTTLHGRPVDPNLVSREFRELATKAGLDLTFHQLRHGAATLMLTQGVALKTVQETLGHSTIAVTADIYGHVVPELKRGAASAIDSALESAAPVTAPVQPQPDRSGPRRKR